MKQMQPRSLRFMTEAGLIGGMYAALCLLLAPISYGAVQVLNQVPGWTLGKLWAVSGYMLLIFMPGKMFFAGMLSKRNYDAALVRLLELKQILPEENSSAVSSKLAQSGEISFEHIAFTYPGGKKVFDGGKKVIDSGIDGGKSLLDSATKLFK